MQFYWSLYCELSPKTSARYEDNLVHSTWWVRTSRMWSCLRHKRTKTKGWTPAANESGEELIDLWSLPNLLPFTLFLWSTQSGAERYLQIIHSTCFNLYGMSGECETTAGWKSRCGKNVSKSTLTQALWNSLLARRIVVCIKLHLTGTKANHNTTSVNAVESNLPSKGSARTIPACLDILLFPTVS